MGGYGSGRRCHYNAHEITDDYRSIDIRKWHKKKLLTPEQTFTCQWLSNGDLKSTIKVSTAADYITLSYNHHSYYKDWASYEYPIQIDWSPCHLGGKRPWFLCPTKHCGRRVAILYSSDIFSCRHCNQLVYLSQREQLHDRTANQADKIREKLNWEPGILNGEGLKPKGMHWSTFYRFKTKHDSLVQMSLCVAAIKFGGLI